MVKTENDRVFIILVGFAYGQIRHGQVYQPMILSFSSRADPVGAEGMRY